MTTALARRRSRSLGRRLILTAIIHSVIVSAAAVTLFTMQRGLQNDLTRATDAFVEEQWIADRVSTAVMRQLMAASAYHRNPDPAVKAEFVGAGNVAHTEIRKYLFRDLSTEQRRQLEAVREQHERLEVEAARALDLVDRGLLPEADSAARTMAGHGLALQGATNSLLAMREADLDRLRARQVRESLYLYAAGGLFAVLLIGSSLLWGRYLHRRIARPLAALGKAARRIGEGELLVRVPTPVDEELATVAGSFNDMADALAMARFDLEKRNRQLEDAVTRVREAQAELVQTEKLSAMGRMMAGLAHELNNPLASVLGYGQLLAQRIDEGDPPSETELQREYVQPIVQEAERARDLVQNLLRFSRKSDPGTAPVPLREAVDVVVRLQAYPFAQASLALDVDPIPDLHVMAEQQRLQQVLLNVVNNAFDALRDGASRAGSRVRIRFEQEGAHVHVTIEDDGPGFEDPERALEPFYTTKSVGEGTGLGLAMVHRFMQQAGGAVRTANRPGGGARVILTFRVAESAAPAPSAVRAPVREAAIASLRVLVVEDEVALRTLQGKLLTRLGANVLMAAGGYEARGILESTEVDLVVSDVKMPDGSGLELFEWVGRERPDLIERFLFVTGDVGDPGIAALARNRPDQFISKPFHKDEYLTRVVALTAPAPTPGTPLPGSAG